MKTFIFLLVLALIVAAYVGGYLPEHRRLLESQQALRASELQIAEMQARLRLYALQSRLARMIETVREGDFGTAATLSSQFFDGVRTEAGEPKDPQAKSSLEAILGSRDTVTSRLAVGDPSVVNVLNGLMSRLQQLADSSPAPGGTDTNSAVPSPAN